MVGLGLQGLRPDLLGRPDGRLLVPARQVVNQTVGGERSLGAGERQDRDQDVGRVPDALALCRVACDIRVGQVRVLGVDHQGAALDRRRVFTVQERLDHTAVQPQHVVVRLLRPPAHTRRDERDRRRALDEALPGDALDGEVVRLDRRDRGRLELLLIENLRSDRRSVEARNDVGADEIDLHDFQTQ